MWRRIKNLWELSNYCVNDKGLIYTAKDGFEGQVPVLVKNNWKKEPATIIEDDPKDIFE